MVEAQAHPFAHILQSHTVGDKSFKFFNMAALGDDRYAKLPFSIRVLLESAIRNCDNFNVKSKSYPD
jgi:aconitate hydratase